MIDFSPLPWGEGGESSEPGEGSLHTEPRKFGIRANSLQKQTGERWLASTLISAKEQSGASRTLGSLLGSEIMAGSERHCCDLGDPQEGLWEACRARIALARASISAAWLSRPVCRSKRA